MIFFDGLGKKTSLPPKLVVFILNTIGIPHLGTRIRYKLALKSLERINPKASILDAGCGYGLIDLKLSRRFKVMAIDNDPARLSVAKSLLGNNPNIKLKLQNLYKLSFKNSSFQVCLTLDVLEHLRDDKKALKELSRVIKRGGYLIISFPEKEANMEGFKSLHHIRPGYTLIELETILKELGFITKEVYPYPKTILGKIALTLDLKLHRVSPFLSLSFFPLFYLLVIFDQKLALKGPPWNYLAVFKKTN